MVSSKLSFRSKVMGILMTMVLIIGLLPVSQAYAADKSGWTRLSGDDRYETMVKVVQEAFEDNSSNYVVIASGQNFADSLTASSLAGVLDAPIILVSANSITDSAAEEIERVGATYAYIVGGISSVSDSVYAKVESIVGAENVERISGSDRYETAVAVADETLSILEGQGQELQSVIIASGAVYADALSISPYAYTTASPIILVGSNGLLDDDSRDWITSSDATLLVVAGGPSSVADGAIAQTGMENSERLSGDNRYETSVEIANWAIDNGHLSANGAVVASGQNFPDALSASALCGQLESVLLLVSTSNTALVEAQEAKDAADAAVIAAQSDVNAAQSAYDTAKAVYDEAVVNYVDYEAYYSKGVAGFWDYIDAGDVADLIEGISDGTFGTNAASTAETDYTVTTAAGNLDNFAVVLDMLDYFNDYRKSVGLSELSVSAYLLALSVASADYADDYYGVSYKHQVASDNNVGENLAWHYGDYVAAYNAWIDEEKAYFDEYCTTYAGTTYSGAAAYNYYQSNKSAIDSWVTSNYGSGYSVGHYINIINPNCKYTGAGYATKDSANSGYAANWNMYEQSFSITLSSTRASYGTYTVSELRTAYNSYVTYISQYKGVTLEELSAAVTEAQTALTQATTALTNAKSEQAAAEAMIIANLEVGSFVSSISSSITYGYIVGGKNSVSDAVANAIATASGLPLNN